MQDFFDRTDFDILATIQSQYAASPRMVELITRFAALIDPTADVELMVEKMVNPMTAEGWGLDVWGRIVALDRRMVVKRTLQEHLGFKKGVHPAIDPYTQNFNNAPFYNPNWYDTTVLSDAAFRNYIFVKALLNIGTSSLFAINLICHLLVPSGLRVAHTGTMELRLIETEIIPDDQLSAFLNLKWAPTGVGVSEYKVIGPTFGFRGSNLSNFNNGTFIPGRPRLLNI